MRDQVPRAELSEEDQARADCYALISRLFYSAPDTELLTSLAGEPGQDERANGPSPDDEAGPEGYAEAFAAFRRACRAADAAALRQEFDDLFIGAGKALFSPYTSGYAVPGAPDRHLVALREHLASVGLSRRDSVFEVEDHVSAVCDVMRWLIERDHPLEEQRSFFDDFVYAGLADFCSAIKTSAASSFYRSVAGFTWAFLALEKDAFAFDEE